MSILTFSDILIWKLTFCAGLYTGMYVPRGVVTSVTAAAEAAAAMRVSF